MDLAQLLAQLMGQRQENPELAGFLADPASRPDVTAAANRVNQIRQPPPPARPAYLPPISNHPSAVMQTPTEPPPFPFMQQGPVPVTPIVRPENPNDPSTFADPVDFARAQFPRRRLPDYMRRPEQFDHEPWRKQRTDVLDEPDRHPFGEPGSVGRFLEPPNASAGPSMAELENRAWTEALARTRSNVSNEGFPMTPRQWGIPGLEAQAAQARRNERYARRRRDEFNRRNPRPNKTAR